MVAINKFLRSVPPALLGQYFCGNFPDLVMTVDWQQDRPALASQLIQLVSQSDFTSRGRFNIDAGRIAAMSDEGGQVALYDTTSDRSELDKLESVYARAMYLFLIDRPRFRRAEAMRYTDDHRNGRIWSGYESQPNLTPRFDAAAMDAFRAAVRTSFATDQVFIDVYNRTRPAYETEPASLVEADIYRDGKIDEEWSIDQGALERKARRKVIEAGITYEPATGIIESCSGEQKARARFVELFAEHLLGVPPPELMGRSRLYDLKPLLSRCGFPNDPKDGIAWVKVVMLKLVPYDTKFVHLTLDVAPNAPTDIWAEAARRFGTANPLAAGWSITRAKLLIRFHPHPDGRPERSLPVTITMPSGCDLKDRSEDERLIGERYLRQWGLKVDGQ